MESSITEWVLRRSAPACDELSITRPGGELYATQFFSARTVKFVLFLPGAGQPYRAAQSRQSAQAAWCALASTFRGRALFSYMSGAAVPDVLEYFGLDAKRDFPVLVAHDPARDRKYLSARPLALEPEELRAFVSGVLEGTLRHALKSEPLPKQAARKSGGSYVVRAVGDTVLEIVGREGRDVLLEVYAPWCAHCRRLAPAVEILARAVAAEDRIVVAKIDGTLNDLPPEGFEVLDIHEGVAGGHYERRWVPVVRADTGEIVQAIVYVALKTGTGLRPTRAYLGFLLAGRDLLPADYWERLRATPTLD